MQTEIADLSEHFKRYRAVTLQALEMIPDEQLGWRPDRRYYSLCQQFIHIAQTEDFHSHGLFDNAWDLDRVRLPKECWARQRIRDYFEQVRGYARRRLTALDRHQLDAKREIPGNGEWSLRSWLWFMLEHELLAKREQLGGF